MAKVSEAARPKPQPAGHWPVARATPGPAKPSAEMPVATSHATVRTGRVSRRAVNASPPSWLTSVWQGQLAAQRGRTATENSEGYPLACERPIGVERGSGWSLPVTANDPIRRMTWMIRAVRMRSPYEAVGGMRICLPRLSGRGMLTGMRVVGLVAVAAWILAGWTGRGGRGAIGMRRPRGHRRPRPDLSWPHRHRQLHARLELSGQLSRAAAAGRLPDTHPRHVDSRRPGAAPARSATVSADHHGHGVPVGHLTHPEPGAGYEPGPRAPTR